MMPIRNLIILLLGVGLITTALGYLAKSSTTGNLQPQQTLPASTYRALTPTPANIAVLSNMLKNAQLSCDLTNIDGLRGQLYIKNGKIRFSSQSKDLLFTNNALYAWTVGSNQANKYTNKPQQEYMTIALGEISNNNPQAEANLQASLNKTFANNPTAAAKLCIPTPNLSDSLFTLPTTLLITPK